MSAGCSVTSLEKADTLSGAHRQLMLTCNRGRDRARVSEPCTFDFDSVIDSSARPRKGQEISSCKAPKSEHCVTQTTHRSDKFIGYRAHCPQLEEWSNVEAALSKSPFLTVYPVSQVLLERHLRDARPIPRGLKRFQSILRANFGRRIDGIDLSFLREQDRAFVDLQAELSGRPRSSSIPRTSGVTAAGRVASAAKGKPLNTKGDLAHSKMRSPTRENLPSETTTTNMKRKRPLSSFLRPTTPTADNGRSATPTMAVSSASSVGKWSTDEGQTLYKRGKNTDFRDIHDGDVGKSLQSTQQSSRYNCHVHKKEIVTRASIQQITESNCLSVEEKHTLARNPSHRPKVEVTETGDIRLNGETLQPGEPRYVRMFGIAYCEKARDPAWTIGIGMVDRCYYRGHKKEAKSRPGDYFPTDHAMLVDFIHRQPQVFVEECRKA